MCSGIRHPAGPLTPHDRSPAAAGRPTSPPTGSEWCPGSCSFRPVKATPIRHPTGAPASYLPAPPFPTPLPGSHPTRRGGSAEGRIGRRLARSRRPGPPRAPRGFSAVAERFFAGPGQARGIGKRERGSWGGGPVTAGERIGRVPAPGPAFRGAPGPPAGPPAAPGGEPSRSGTERARVAYAFFSPRSGEYRNPFPARKRPLFRIGHTVPVCEERAGERDGSEWAGYTSTVGN
jgi:hypothetical protein